MIDEPVLSPTQFVDGFNMLVGYNLPTVIIEGEITEFRVSKNRWLYFNIVDEQSSVACFGTVYMLKQPVEDGMVVRLQAAPKLHNKFGFSLNLISIMPVGAGAIKRSAELLKAKLESEGIFAAERKRPMPFAPAKVGLITSEGSAAYHDFIKILESRWVGVNVLLSDVAVQGESAPGGIVRAIESQNQMLVPPEVIVLIRGGGSAEDLQAFNDEQVVRSVASSRVPTLAAIGHEVDISLAELAADMHCSTPTNAAAQLFPDKVQEAHGLTNLRQKLDDSLDSSIKSAQHELGLSRQHLLNRLKQLISAEAAKLERYRALLEALNPDNILKRGYAIVRQGNQVVKSARAVKPSQNLITELADGKITSSVTSVELKGSKHL